MSRTTRQWTATELDAAEAHLRTSDSVPAAVAVISATVRQCDGDSLLKAFKRSGRPRPAELIRRTVAAQDSQPDMVFTYTGAPPPDYEDDKDTVRVEVRDTEPVPFREERILVIPDAHWPYVDEAAWTLMMRVARFLSPHRIVVLGDFADCLAVSFHPKSAARRANLADEVAATGRGWDDLDSLGAEHKHLLQGNHEFRLVRFINERAPELHGLVGLTIEEMFRLSERGRTCSKYLKEHCVGDWRMSHDYGDAGPYALKRAIDVTDSNTIIGHTHRMAEHVGVARKDGRTIRGMSFGWLGSFDDIDYVHRAKARRDWAHGCGVGFTRPDGTVRFEAVRFAGGDTRVDGQRVAA